MEALWVGQRAHLRHLLRLHPDWTLQQVADAVGCSTSMVSKWKRRFAQANEDDVGILFSRSRAATSASPAGPGGGQPGAGTTTHYSRTCGKVEGRGDITRLKNLERSHVCLQPGRHLL